MPRASSSASRPASPLSRPRALQIWSLHFGGVVDNAVPHACDDWSKVKMVKTSNVVLTQPRRWWASSWKRISLRCTDNLLTSAAKRSMLSVQNWFDQRAKPPERNIVVDDESTERTTNPS
jgi:hypothetical protein